MNSPHRTPTLATAHSASSHLRSHLQEGELSHLQQVLHGIPELQDDEKMLREIE